MRHLPVFLDLAGRPCLVVGGGEVAVRKVERLLSAGARVTVVSPRMSPRLDAIAAREASVRLVRRGYSAGDLAGMAIAFAATGDERTQEEIARDARQAGVWLNAADDPARCSFLMPAVVERGPVTVAVSTGGASPALARAIRDEIAARLGPEYSAAAEHLAELRRRYAASPARGRAFAQLLGAGLLEALRRHDRTGVDRLTRAACAALEGEVPEA